MRCSKRKMSNAHYLPFASLLICIFAISLACSLPRVAQPTVEVLPNAGGIEVPTEELPSPTQTSPPTPTPQPLPPALVEVDPPPGVDFPLKGPLTLYFNQPMDRPSVEIALTGQPALAGRFNWVDDATVAFEPDAPYLPGTDLTIDLSTSALSLNGQFLQDPVSLAYRTVSPLQAVQVLPEANGQEIDPTTAVVATFNQPVVPLGADPASLQAAFTLDPSVAGRGEWVNTSTYIFYPDPPLAGGTNYTVQLNPDLQSTAGGPFLGRENCEASAFEWNFTTALPRLVSIDPGDGAGAVRLDANITLAFNQPMDVASVEENFTVYDAATQPVPGEIGWSADFTTLTFTPTNLLAHDAGYNIFLLGTAQAQGHTPLGTDYIVRIHTVPELGIVTTEPVVVGTTQVYSGIVLHFNGPAQTEDPLQYISISPEVPNLSYWWRDFDRTLYVNGDLSAMTTYTATISSAFPDPWGGTLGEAYTLNFQTAPLDPSLFIAHGETALFLTPQETSILAQATNLDKIGIRLGSVPFGDLVTFLAPGGYDTLKNYQPAGRQNWTYTAGLPGDRSYTVQLPIAPDEAHLEPGIYHLSFLIPGMAYTPGPYLLVSSNVHLSFKLSTTSAFVWAVDLRTNAPVPGATVNIYDHAGNLLASGPTDEQGVFQSPIPTQPDLYTTYYAVLSEPGNEYFSLSLSNWSQGIEGYDFGYLTDFTAPGLMAYLYTDRPIYRPGQTVYFRAVVRHEHNGRYALPDVDIVPITVYDNDYAPALTLDLPLSQFGTVHGEYLIPDDAQPGYYQISTPYGSVPFQVAEYRKPEINLQVESEPNPTIAGQSITVQVNARYFFDVPSEASPSGGAGNVPLSWNLYKTPADFHIPGYQVGSDNFRWMDPPWASITSAFGELISSGKSNTNSGGLLTIEFPTDPEADSPYRYTLEVTTSAAPSAGLTDESNFPVSARTEVMVHPSDFYIGVRPDTRVGQAGNEISFEVLVVDWEQHSAGVRDLSAQFQKVTWVRQDSPDPFSYPTFTPQYTPVSSADFRTAPDGVARLAFTPPEPGTYQLDVSDEQTRTQVLVWVGGSGQAVWPNLPNQRLRLTADREDYTPGDTAQIFIPNSFGAGTQALVTVERDEILRHQVITLDEGGYNLPLPLTDADAPNVYVSVTLIGRDANGKLDFRQGYLNLPVEPVAQTLNVEINATHPQGATHFGPRDEVTFNVRITDAAGDPVQGEFSLAVVDLAALALADPNAVDILPAFYDEQPLGVRTGMSLVVYAQRRTNVDGGLGSGGEEPEAFILRQDFPDTVYWNAEVVTNVDGEAEVALRLPDSLTTWEVDLRGLTADTRVGQAREEIVTTKDLLVRPVTPRFLVAGDHTQLAAVVHNNTLSDLQVDVTLQATGFTLDGANTQTQSVSIPAGGRVRVAWWGTTEDVESLDLVFSATGGGLTDATRPTVGELPMLRYTAPQTFSTAGVLDIEGERLEMVSLPRSWRYSGSSTAGQLSGGTLEVELAPSLAAAMTSGLEVLEQTPYECTEQTLSRFLPNLMAYRTLQDLGLDSPDLQARLERTLDEGIQKLTSRQNEDGGWGWWPARQVVGSSGSLIVGQTSDPYITAYVVFGLSQARGAGVFVDEAVLQNGANYLLATMPAFEMLSSTWQMDRLAFHYFALAQTDSISAASARNLYDVRDQLSPWAKAFLALTLEMYDPEDPRAGTLLSDLESVAIRSGSGIHWEGSGVKANLETPVFNTAVVVYTLAQNVPASFILPEAVRYLMSNRDAEGGWGSTYQTAWTLMALTEVMKGTGELAGNFGFAASLNGNPLVEGQAGGDARLNPVSASVPVSDLYPDDPNALSLRRTAGPGRLYYTAHLNLMRPAEDVAPSNRGIGVSRYYETGDGRLKTEDAAPGPRSSVGELVTVRIAVTLEDDAYYLVVEDYIPAGAEILDTSLKTSQVGNGECEMGNAECYDVRPPFGDGWGWWYFGEPLIYDDHIAWAVDYLPAGTYELTYTLVLNHPGQYHTLPARAWEFYFPEVQGNSAGEIFKIEGNYSD